MSSLIRALRDSDPDEVYNLGAVSFVAHSWENAQLTTDVTAKGVLNMLEAVRAAHRRQSRQASASQASSSGDVRQGPGGPAARARTACCGPARPRRQQGVRALHDDQLPRVLRHARLVGILFNHESPRRGPEFVTRKIGEAVARIKLGLQDELVLGQPDAERDWGSPATTSRRCG